MSRTKANVYCINMDNKRRNLKEDHCIINVHTPIKICELKE